MLVGRKYFHQKMSILTMTFLLVTRVEKRCHAIWQDVATKFGLFCVDAVNYITFQSMCRVDNNYVVCAWDLSFD